MLCAPPMITRAMNLPTTMASLSTMASCSMAGPTTARIRSATPICRISDIATAEADIRVILPQDIFELNDTSDKPTNFGFFAGNTTIDKLTIAGHPDLLPDYDWYSFITAASGSFSATIGYLPNGGGDLNMRVFTVDANNTLIQIGASLAQGTTMQSVRVDVPAGIRILVWVYGFNFAEGTYAMNLSL